jgi:hypothetical protein
MCARLRDGAITTLTGKRPRARVGVASKRLPSYVTALFGAARLLAEAASRLE